MVFEYCRNEQIFEYYTIRFSPNDDAEEFLVCHSFTD